MSLIELAESWDSKALGQCYTATLAFAGTQSGVPSGWSHGFSLVSLISNLGDALGVVGGKIVAAISEDVLIQLIPERVPVFL